MIKRMEKGVEERYLRGERVDNWGGGHFMAKRSQQREGETKRSETNSKSKPWPKWAEIAHRKASLLKTNRKTSKPLNVLRNLLFLSEFVKAHTEEKTAKGRRNDTVLPSPIRTFSSPPPLALKVHFSRPHLLRSWRRIFGMERSEENGGGGRMGGGGQF